MFTEQEVTYLQSQRLARIATVADDDQVDVAPVGYHFDGTHFFITGRRQKQTLKYKNVAAGRTKVALVVDDLESVDPWKPRGVKIHGMAQIIGAQGDQPTLKITPKTHWSWGLEGSSYRIQKREW